MFTQSSQKMSCNFAFSFTLILFCLLPCFHMSKQYITEKFLYFSSH